MAGVETFNQNWRNNQNAQFSFAPNALASADFNRVYLGRINLETGAFDTGLTVLAPEKGLLIVAAIGDGGLGTGANPILNIDYQDGQGFPTLDQIFVGALDPQGTEYIFDPPNDVADITNVSPSDLLTSGVVDFYGPTSYVEDFETRWPAATQGL